MRRRFGFIASLAALLVVAGYFLFGIMIGDCDPEAFTRMNCEASRSHFLMGWLVLTLGALSAVVWVFFFRTRNQQGGD